MPQIDIDAEREWYHMPKIDTDVVTDMQLVYSYGLMLDLRVWIGVMISFEYNYFQKISCQHS